MEKYYDGNVFYKEEIDKSRFFWLLKNQLYLRNQQVMTLNCFSWVLKAGNSNADQIPSCCRRSYHLKEKSLKNEAFIFEIIICALMNILQMGKLMCAKSKWIYRIQNSSCSIVIDEQIAYRNKIYPKTRKRNEYEIIQEFHSTFFTDDVVNYF